MLFDGVYIEKSTGKGKQNPNSEIGWEGSLFTEGLPHLLIDALKELAIVHIT
jgi:hypothetical protein